MASPSMVPRELYLQTGLPLARRIVARIGGAVVYSFASARGLGVAPDVLGAGVAGVTASAGEDLAALKATCAGRAAVVGGLDGIPMRSWSPEQASAAVRAAIRAAGPGAGFVLSENHGEIPIAVPEATLVAIAEAARRYGRYPLEDLA
jgi:uroporphyrinogen decarboxylase